MPANGNYLIFLTVATLLFLLFLILVVKLHAFMGLLISAMGMGLAAGMPPEKVLKSIQTGFGDALGFIAVVLALGAMIGRFLEYSGGGHALADWLLAKIRQGKRGLGHAGLGLPGGAAHLLRGGLHHPDPAGVESGARDQTLSAVLRLAHGRGAHHDPLPGAAASGAVGRHPTAGRRSGQHDSVGRRHVAAHGDRRRYLLRRLDRAPHLHPAAGDRQRQPQGRRTPRRRRPSRW